MRSLFLMTASMIALLFFSAGTGIAATWTVTSGADDGSSGTLRSVVTNAAAGDTIVFSSSVSTVELTSYLFLNKALTISGTSGKPVTIRQTGANERVLYVTGDCTLNYLTIRGGNFVPGTQQGNYWNGAGIFNYANLTMNHCTVTENSVGAGVFNAKNLTMTGCTISNNTCTGSRHAGGINNEASAYSSPVLTMYACVVEGNSNPDTYGGGIFNGEQLFMYGCTVRNNSSKGSGGGMYLNLFSETTLAQGCVVTGNSPDQIVGPGSYGFLKVDGTCTIGTAPGSASVSLSGFAGETPPSPRRTVGEPDVEAVERDLNDPESELFGLVKNVLSADLGDLPREMSATLYNAFTYENIPLTDASGEGKLEIEFTASWPEYVRYYAAFAQPAESGSGALLEPGAYAIPERGIQFEIKPGQDLPEGVTPPDFYEEGEGLMTWRNVVEDNGPFDLNNDVGVVTFRVASIRAEAEIPARGSSGCNAGGDAAPFALLLGLPLLKGSRNKS
jgi:hypothetical protein